MNVVIGKRPASSSNGCSREYRMSLIPIGGHVPGLVQSCGEIRIKI